MGMEFYEVRRARPENGNQIVEIGDETHLIRVADGFAEWYSSPHGYATCTERPRPGKRAAHTCGGSIRSRDARPCFASRQS